MTPQLPASLSRLATANPEVVDDRAARQPHAQAMLTRILDSDPASEARARTRRGRGQRIALIALPLIVLGAGGAVAATDPLGWFASPNPDTAIYRSTTSRTVSTPTARSVGCQPAAATTFRCGPSMHGRPYTLIDTIPAAPSANAFSRPAILQLIRQAVASGKLAEHRAQRVRAELSRVPDSFLATLGRRGDGEYQGGPDPTPQGVQLVPPPGVPSFLACQPAGAALSCQNLNGDAGAPVGSGVYEADQTSDWRPTPPRRREPGTGTAPRFTPAEWRFLTDLVAFAETGTSSMGAAGARRYNRR